MNLIAPHQRLATQASVLAFALASRRVHRALIHAAPIPHTLSEQRLHLRRRTRLPVDREAGTTTAEYAIGTLAACAFAAVLYKILTGGSVAAALGGLIHRALGLAG